MFVFVIPTAFWRCSGKIFQFDFESSASAEMLLTHMVERGLGEMDGDYFPPVLYSS